jgi:glutamate-1-semialdehyde aminotransferase
MVRFARSGGEINSVAVRIARASTGKDKIAVCGYHGWHDWYISSVILNNQNLNQHLLPGLNLDGVPKAISWNSIAF